MLGQRLRRWSNINPTLGERLCLLATSRAAAGGGSAHLSLWFRLRAESMDTGQTLACTGRDRHWSAGRSALCLSG